MLTEQILVAGILLAAQRRDIAGMVDGTRWAGGGLLGMPPAPPPTSIVVPDHRAPAAIMQQQQQQQPFSFSPPLGAGAPFYSGPSSSAHAALLGVWSPPLGGGGSLG